jgi:hypothetical protein
VVRGLKGGPTAGDYYEKAERKDAGYANFVFELHLKSRYHDNGEEDDDDVCCDVD